MLSQIGNNMCKRHEGMEKNMIEVMYMELFLAFLFVQVNRKGYRRVKYAETRNGC